MPHKSKPTIYPHPVFVFFFLTKFVFLYMDNSAILVWMKSSRMLIAIAV